MIRKVFLLPIFAIIILSAYIYIPIISNNFKYNIWVSFIDFPMFILYLATVWISAIFYTKFFQQKFTMISYLLLIMAIFCKLAIYLVKTRLDFNNTNPFVSNLPFKLYSQAYFSVLIFMFGIATGRILRAVIYNEKDYFLTGELNYKARRFIFYSPIYILWLYFSLQLISTGDILSFILIILGFFSSIFFISTPGFIRRVISKAAIFLRSDTFRVLFIFIFAFLIRYLWGLRLISMLGINFPTASDDGVTYSPFAAVLARGGQIPAASGLYWGGIGYWYFLSLIYRFLGVNNYSAVVLIQSVIGSTVPLAIYYISKMLFNKITALVAALLSVFSFNLIFLSAVIGMEALFIPLMLITIAVLIRIILNKNQCQAINFFGAGLLLGLTFSARQEVLLFPVIILICVFVFLRREMAALKIFKNISLLLLGMSVFLIMIAQHNYVNYGKSTFFTRNVSNTFSKPYYGSKESAELDKLGFNPFENLSLAKSALFNDPVRTTALLAKSVTKKGIKYLFVPNFGMFDPFTLVNPICYFSGYAVFLSFCALLFLVFGVILGLREKEKGKKASIYIILGYIIYTFCIYALIKAGNARHRGVLEPLFLMFISYAICGFFRWIKQPEFEKSQ